MVWPSTIWQLSISSAISPLEELGLWATCVVQAVQWAECPLQGVELALPRGRALGALSAPDSCCHPSS